MIVFSGPSLSGTDLSHFSQISFLPPCRQGDVYRAVQSNPTVIGIIDGYFEGSPSVWHKEILHALSQGIPVIGAASMGALRAAELYQFGMIGIGKVYEGYRNGIYMDDDEVALLHGPAELNYPSLSLAMVNVRATVAKALDEGVISDAQHIQIVNTAKSCFYKSRTWQSIFSKQNLREIGTDELMNWFEINHMDQKQLDALELLNAMQTQAYSRPDPSAFTFEVTNFWHRNSRMWRQRQPSHEENSQETGYRLFGKDIL